MSDLKTAILDHPRLAGVLFMTVLLLAQAGSVAAMHCQAYHGP